MPDLDKNAAYAEGYLRRALEVTNVARRAFQLGQSTRDEIITTNRFIVVLRGELRYTIEGRALTMRAGMEFLVPAWVRRVWSVPRGGECEIAWCEFDEGSEGGEWAGFVRRKLEPAELALETAAFRRLLRRYREPDGAWTRLQLEAELKLLLVRFLERAEISPGAPSLAVHPRVKASLRWLNSHFRDRDVLEALYRQAELTPNYFRERFSEAAQCSPHEYIERLRLRHARYLLHGTDWQLKRIASEVGYDDPLYFSRLYRRFWKRPPSEERGKS
jgi:AraC-like DNA-binding protein